MDDNNYALDWQNGRTLYRDLEHRNCEKKKEDLVIPIDLSTQCTMHTL